MAAAKKPPRPDQDDDGSLATPAPSLTARQERSFDKRARAEVKRLDPDDDYLAPLEPRADRWVVREPSISHGVGPEAVAIAEASTQPEAKANAKLFKPW